MNAVIRPVETEYSGVVFRSKTEAVFARCLDLARVPWKYEPAFMTQTGEQKEWVPDFCVMWPREWRAMTDGEIAATLLEIKPSKPTQAYICSVEDLFDRCMLPLVGVSGWLSWAIVCDFWESRRGAIVGKAFSGSDGVCNELSRYLGTVLEHVQDARRYRFDLENGGKK
jgi:hypothetical protein